MTNQELYLIIVISTLLCLGSYWFYKKLQFWFFLKRNLEHAKVWPEAAKARRSVPYSTSSVVIIILIALILSLFFCAFLVKNYVSELNFMLNATQENLVIEKKKRAGKYQNCLVSIGQLSRYIHCPYDSKPGDTLNVYYNPRQKPFLMSRHFGNHATVILFSVLILLALMTRDLIQDFFTARQLVQTGQLTHLPILNFLKFEVKNTTTIRCFTRYRDQVFYVDCLQSTLLKQVKVGPDLLAKNLKVWVQGDQMAHLSPATKTIEGFKID